MTDRPRWPAGLATLAVGGGAFFVLVVYASWLQAPFLVPKFAALEIAASLGLVAFVFDRVLAPTSAPWAPAIRAGVWLVLITSVLSFIASFGLPYGSTYALPALARWGALFGVACGASVLQGRAQAVRAVLDVVTLAAAVVSAIGLLQHVELLPFGIPILSLPGSTFGNRNLAAEVIAMALPLGLAATQTKAEGASRSLVWGSLAIELCYLGVTRARGAWAGALAGIAVALWSARPRWSRRGWATGAGVVGALLVIAAIPGRFNPRHVADTKRYSAVVDVIEEGFDPQSTALRTRLGLWRRTIRMIGDHLVFGVGPGNWPVVFPKYAEPDAFKDGVLTATLAPRQAHDDALERTAETGIPGALSLAFLVAATAVTARRRLVSGEPDERPVIAGASGSLVALVLISTVGFPLEMPGTLTLAGIALGFVAPRARAPSRPALDAATAPSLATVAGLCAGATALLLFVVVRAERSVRHGFWLGVAERALRRDHSVEAAAEGEAALERAVSAMPDDFRTDLRRSQALLRLDRAQDAARAAQSALRLEPYSPNGWYALADAERTAGELGGAYVDVSHALELIQDYPAALELHAEALRARGDSAGADADWTRLEALAQGPTNDATARKAREIVQASR